MELAGYRITDSSPKGTPQLPGALGPAAGTSAQSKLPFEPLSLTFKVCVGVCTCCCCCCAWCGTGLGAARSCLSRRHVVRMHVCSVLTCRTLVHTSLSQQDICYDVPRPKSSSGEKQNDSEVGENTLRLLRHVSGAFRPGVLTALMGASGAGKVRSHSSPCLHEGCNSVAGCGGRK